MIHISEHAKGCVLPVRVQPGARRQGIVGEQAGTLKIAVHSAPEQGKANRAVIEVLCEAFGLRKNQIELLSGATSRDKKFLLRDIDIRLLAEKCMHFGEPGA